MIKNNPKGSKMGWGEKKSEMVHLVPIEPDRWQHQFDSQRSAALMAIWRRFCQLNDAASIPNFRKFRNWSNFRSWLLPLLLLLLVIIIILGNKKHKREAMCCCNWRGSGGVDRKCHVATPPRPFFLFFQTSAVTHLFCSSTCCHYFDFNDQQRSNYAKNPSGIVNATSGNAGKSFSKSLNPKTTPKINWKSPKNPQNIIKIPWKCWKIQQNPLEINLKIT